MTKYKSDDDIFVLFAHANYQLDIGFKKLNPPYKSIQHHIILQKFLLLHHNNPHPL